MIPTLELHKNTVAKHAAQIAADCQSGNCGTYYATSYYLHGILSGVEASGNEELLAQTIHYLELMMQAALSLDKNGITYHYWKHPAGDPVTGLGSDGRPLQKDHFQAFGPFARAVFIIASHPTWKVTYKSTAETLADFARHNGLEYWFDRTNGVYAGSTDWNWVAGKIPWLPLDLGGQNSTSTPPNLPPNHPNEWNDKATLAGILAAWLAAANPQDLFCIDIANRLATGFRRRLTLQKGGWVWDVLQVNWDVLKVSDKNTPDHDTRFC